MIKMDDATLRRRRHTNCAGLGTPRLQNRSRSARSPNFSRSLGEGRFGLRFANPGVVTTYQPHPLAERIVGAAIQVHRALGPGLLESSYQRCLACEFTMTGIAFRSEVTLPLEYRNLRISCGYRVDFIVEDEILLELKSVERLLPIHEAQVITYLKLTGLPRALLMNFNVPVLGRGVKSFLRPTGASDAGTVHSLHSSK